MCGIAGVFAPGRRLGVDALNVMLSSMAHRGPDDLGTQALAGAQLLFGHVRLSILDLSPLGHQPMTLADRKVWIVYNGEVYNFREIRAELEPHGWGFRSDSDTEVVVTAYCQWGLDAIEGFRGMLAFALVDETEGHMPLVLDGVEERMVGGGAVGVFLRGGNDPSLVAALLARRSGLRLRTFTIGFGASEFDETRYARTVAENLRTEHVEYIVSHQAALDLVAEIPSITDEPIGDSSLIPTLMVSRLARQHVKVALSADGADELFGGYARYAYCGDFLGGSSLMQTFYRLPAHLIHQLPPPPI